MTLNGLNFSLKRWWWGVENTQFIFTTKHEKHITGTNWDKTCDSDNMIVDTHFVKIVAINAVEVAHVSVSLRLESSAGKESSQIKVEGSFL